eukprot:4931849-Karenia_brevis.AAC.1
MQIVPHLPRAILLGHTPHLQSIPTSTFWSKQDDPLQNTSLNTVQKQQCGIDMHTLDTTFGNWLNGFTEAYAISSYHQLNYCPPCATHPTPPFVLEDHPSAINVFSDGGFTLPTMPRFGLMSAGVWWTSRQEGSELLLSVGEADYACQSANGTGIR